jgi:hypothetical protein
MNEATTASASAAPPGAEPGAAPEHLRKEQLFPFLHALGNLPLPPVDGEGADPELARVLRELPDPFKEPLATEDRLGPETVERLLAHTKSCVPCRSLLIEDGPGARPKKTEADVKAEVDRKETERRAKVRRFWIGAAGGAVGFMASKGTFYMWARRKHVEQPTGTALKSDERDKATKVDPVFLLGMGFAVIAAFCLTDAYIIARELWIDFSKWKRAVPVIGNAWADRDKRPSD